MATSINQLIAARGVQGIGGALLVPGSLAIISASFAPDQRGRAIGFADVGTGFGMVLFIPGSAWLIETFGWRPAFVVLGAVIVVLEGAQHLYQYQEHWITYRSTAEALKHERYLYLAQAGPYAGDDRHSQLAERLEGLISQEHANWTADHRSSEHHQQGQ